MSVHWGGRGPGHTSRRTKKPGAGPPPLPAFSDYGYEYSEDFETARVVDGTNNLQVLTAGQSAKWRADSGYLHITDLFQAQGSIAFGPVSGLPENIHFRIGYNASVFAPEDGPFEYNRGGHYLWYVDASNHVRFSFSSNRISLAVVVGGSTVASSRFDLITWGSPGALDIFVINGFFYAMQNGKWLHITDRGAYPFDGLDISAVSAPNRVGRVGGYQEIYRWPLAYSWDVTPLYFSVDDHPMFFARDSKTAPGVSGRSITGKYWTKVPARLAYRVIDYNNNATVIKNWTEMTDPVIGGGDWSGKIDVPSGGPYAIDCAGIDADGKYHVFRMRPVIVGALFFFDGQSNSVARVNNSVGKADITTACAQVGASYPGNVAGQVSNLYNNFDVVTTYSAAKVVAQASGVPALVVAIGVPGASLDLLVSTHANWSRVTNAIAAFGKPEGVLWDQGEGDGDGASAPTGYAAAWNTGVRDGYRAATGNATLPFLLIQPGRYASATGPNELPWAQSDAQREVLRQQFLACVAADPYVKLGPSCHLGEPHSDAYHYTAASYAEDCRRGGYSIAKEFLGSSTPDGRGPKVTSASLNGGRDVITLTLDLDGATTLTDIVNIATGTVPTPSLAGGLYGYQVSVDDFTSLRTISSIVRSGTNQLVITLSAAAPAGTVKVRSFYGASYDDTNLFYGTGYADSRANLPVDPIRTPLVAA